MKKLRVGLIVDDGPQAFLNFDLYRRSLDSACYSIEYLIVQQTSGPTGGGLAKRLMAYAKKRGVRRLIDRLAFEFVERLENWIVLRSRKFKEYFVRHGLSEFQIPKLNVEPLISASGLVYRYSTGDLEKIRGLKLDVLVRGGSGILRGEILDLCRLGILSFHHADNDVNRGGPPGFWEVFNREASTGFVIQRLSSELDGGDVIYKGSVATSFLYKVNACRICIKSSFFLHRMLEQLSKGPEQVPVHPKVPYPYLLYTTPTWVQVFRYLLMTFVHGLKKVIGKVGRKSYRWGVAYQFVEDWRSAVLWRSKVIKNPPHRFLADPFVATHEGRTVVFVEDFDVRVSRGKISAYEVDPAGYKELGVALEEDFHLSYPFLFRTDDGLYMVPETHEANDIRLYKCIEFPLKWQFQKTLMQGFGAADSSLFKFGDKWWLFTSRDSSDLGDLGSELHIFHADRYDSSEWHPHPLNPVIFDSGRGRNGGLILSGGEVFRVFQKQGFDLYGAAMGVSKVTVLTHDRYEEEVLCDIPPSFMKNIKGSHTLSFDSGVLCLDFVRYEGFGN